MLRAQNLHQPRIFTQKLFAMFAEFRRSDCTPLSSRFPKEHYTITGGRALLCIIDDIVNTVFHNVFDLET